MTRQEANLKIAKLLDKTEIRKVARAFRECAESYPSQRCGQIFCNYICYDYRTEEPGDLTKEVLGFLFPGNPDPFFEESEVTLRRLRKIIKTEKA